ncbi:MAG TPA: hypothetical protein VJX67_26585 [Blastocatellia bacterium]|nr:hypothetical protein [Blastocatellia bacterium]
MQPDSKLSALIRHLLTIAGGYVAAKGRLNAANTQLLIGVLTALAGVTWSLVDKTKVGKYIDTALDLKAGSTRQILEDAITLGEQASARK